MEYEVTYASRQITAEKYEESGAAHDRDVTSVDVTFSPTVRLLRHHMIDGDISAALPPAPLRKRRGDGDSVALSAPE